MVTWAASAPPYIRHKCRAMHFVPHLLHCSPVGRAAGERGEFDADPAGFRIDVRLGRNDAESANAAHRCDPIIDRMCQRFLEIVAARRCELFDLLPNEVVIPGKRRIVTIRRRDVIKPDLDGNQQTLRRADLEVVKSDVRHDFERIEEDSRASGPEGFGNQPLEIRPMFLACVAHMFLPEAVHALRLQELDVAFGRREALAAIDEKDLAGDRLGRNEVADCGYHVRRLDAAPKRIARMNPFEILLRLA